MRKLSKNSLIQIEKRTEVTQQEYRALYRDCKAEIRSLRNLIDDQIGKLERRLAGRTEG